MPLARAPEARWICRRMSLAAVWPGKRMEFLVDARDKDLAHALEHGRFGLGFVDANLKVSRRCGVLSEWLPIEGEAVCSSPFLMHMEEALQALQDQKEGEMLLPSMRLPALGTRRVTISIAWNAQSQCFVVVTTPDHGADQIDRLLASERREKQLLEQQAEAAAARLRVADTLYRDLVESSGDLVLRFRTNGRIVFANRFASRFLGVAQDALLERQIDALFPSMGEDSPWRLDAYATQPASFEMAARDAQGALVWFWWDVRFSGPRGAGEFQAVGRDVTDARRLRAEQDKAREEARAAALASQRLRIAHDLHDTLVRSIVTLIVEMGLVARTTADEAAGKALTSLQAQARAGLVEARDAITHLRSQRREDDDPAHILQAFGERMRKTRALDLNVRAALDFEALPAEIGDCFRRILREALRNIELHANARRVDVELRREDSFVLLDIRDDGVGFDPAQPKTDHFGLLGIKERAISIGATLEISSAPGEGAHLSLRAPIEPV